MYLHRASFANAPYAIEGANVVLGIHPDSRLDSDARRLLGRYLQRAREQHMSVKVGDLIPVELTGCKRLFKVLRVEDGLAVLVPFAKKGDWMTNVTSLLALGVAGLAWLGWCLK